MIDQKLFRLPMTLPHGSWLVGPWAEDTVDLARERQGQAFPAPAKALRSLATQAKQLQPSDSLPLGKLVFLHQDAFAGPEGADALVTWLEDLAELRAPYLPILLHGNLDGTRLVRFFRAGLFDALTIPLTQVAWVNMLIRAEKRLEFRFQSQLILETTGQTRQMLRRLRDQLGADAGGTMGDLMGAKESLEAANRQLTDAMAELGLLYRFGRELSTAGNWDAVLREILRNLTDFVGAGGAALILRSAPGGGYSPRQTWQWEESAWDKVLVNLNDQVDAAVAESIMAPGVFSVTSTLPAVAGAGRRIIALPLEHQEMRLGYLLLLFVTPAEREAVSARYLPFLQTVQVVLSEEVASAQMLDRIRDIGAFNARVLETVRSSIWVLDESGRTVYCNRSGQEMLTGHAAPLMAPEDFLFQIGRGRADADEADDEAKPGTPELILDARLHLDDLPGLLLPALRAAPEATFRGEGQILREDGEGIPVLVQTSLMPGHVRDETWLVVVAEDLRDSRQLEAERLRADRLEGLVEMSATLAHEIRNPLMGLSAQAELLAGQLKPGDSKARYIEVIIGEVERINETITRMLNYVRPYQPRRHQTAFGPLGQDVIDLVRPRAAQKKVTLALAGLTGPGLAHGLVLDVDGNQIKQVLLNLLLNAIDAAPEGGEVRLRIEARCDLGLQDVRTGLRQTVAGILAEVSDNGPGFRPEDAHKLFRPFFTTKSSGTGLGLSICHKIVAAHGGDITAARVADLTVFRMLLPAGGTTDQPMLTMEEDAR
jgi:signal transduction histidine kinase